MKRERRRSINSERKRPRLGRVEGFRVPEIYTKFKQYPRITNYVSTVSLEVKFDLNSIVLYISSGSREPDQFAALTLKLGNTTCLLFATGNMVVTGAKTENDSKLAAHSYRLMLERTEQPFYDPVTRDFYHSTLEEYTQFLNFKIENIVGDTQVVLDPSLPSKNRIDLDLLDEYVGNTATSLNSEIFPGLRFFIDRSPECPIKKKCLMAYIFSGAKVVIMGADVKEDIYISNDYLRKIIEPYLRASGSSASSDEKSKSTTYKSIVKLLNATPFKMNAQDRKKLNENLSNTGNMPDYVPSEDEIMEEEEQDPESFYTDPDEIAKALFFMNDFIN